MSQLQYTRTKMKFSEFTYKRIDLEEAKKKIREITETVKNASSAEEQIEAVYRMNEVEKELSTASSLVYIRYTVNTKDEFYAKEREYNNRISPILEEEMQKYNEALLQSPFRNELEEKFGKVLFLNLELAMKGFSPEITELLQEESALQTQYQSLLAGAQIEFQGELYNLSQLGLLMQSQDREIRRAAYEAYGKFFDDNQEELDEIFDKLVKNRTEQAYRLGMKNFVELGYVRRQRNCYAPEAISDFRDQVVRDLVPVVCENKKTQAECIGVDNLKIYDDSFRFLDGNPVPQGSGNFLVNPQFFQGFGTAGQGDFVPRLAAAKDKLSLGLHRKPVGFFPGFLGRTAGNGYFICFRPPRAIHGTRGKGRGILRLLQSSVAPLHPHPIGKGHPG